MWIREGDHFVNTETGETLSQAALLETVHRAPVASVHVGRRKGDPNYDRIGPFRSLSEAVFYAMHQDRPTRIVGTGTLNPREYPKTEENGPRTKSLSITVDPSVYDDPAFLASLSARNLELFQGGAREFFILLPKEL